MRNTDRETTLFARILELWTLENRDKQDQGP